MADLNNVVKTENRLKSFHPKALVHICDHIEEASVMA